MLDTPRFVQSTIDALSSEICVLDETGKIIAVNQAWKLFREANDKMACDPPGQDSCGEGANYLAVCDRAIGPEASDAVRFAVAVRSILNRERDCYSMEYPCHSPDKHRWFVVNVTRFDSEGRPRIVIEHHNI